MLEFLITLRVPMDVIIITQMCLTILDLLMEIVPCAVLVVLCGNGRHFQGRFHLDQVQVNMY